MKLHEEGILLLDAKVYYKQAGMWMAAEDTGKTIEQAYEMMKKTIDFYCESVTDIKENLYEIGKMRSAIEQKNPGLIDEINDILSW